jgi:hypothetical protein
MVQYMFAEDAVYLLDVRGCILKVVVKIVKFILESLSVLWQFSITSVVCDFKKSILVYQNQSNAAASVCF